MVTKVYLAGAIHDKSDAECKDWREEAVHDLQVPGMIEVINPMRRDYRGNQVSTRDRIVALDKRDIRESDILLVNASQDSWGTAMEVMYAHERDKIIIVFSENSPQDMSPWVVFHSTILCGSLKEALDMVREVQK